MKDDLSALHDILSVQSASNNSAILRNPIQPNIKSPSFI
jgi:hypothetical protein